MVFDDVGCWMMLLLDVVVVGCCCFRCLWSFLWKRKTPRKKTVQFWKRFDFCHENLRSWATDRFHGMFPKIGGFPPKMDGEKNGKPLVEMDDLGGKPLFLETPSWIPRICQDSKALIPRDPIFRKKNPLENYQAALCRFSFFDEHIWKGMIRHPS